MSIGKINKATDIVTRLRAVFYNDRSVELMNREAADEIEMLRVERNFDAIEIADMRKLVDEAIAATLRPLSETAESIRELHNELDCMRSERDEARRQYCRGFTDFCPNPAHDHLSLEDAAVEVAKSFGWDCFKENTDA